MAAARAERDHLAVEHGLAAGAAGEVEVGGRRVRQAEDEDGVHRVEVEPPGLGRLELASNSS